MPEIRRDPLTGRCLILAPERAFRPDDFGDKTVTRRPPSPDLPDPSPLPPEGIPETPGSASPPGTLDPFAPGNERETPPELFAIRPAGGAADQPGWTMRVVPNRYPAVKFLTGDGWTGFTDATFTGNGLFDEPHLAQDDANPASGEAFVKLRETSSTLGKASTAWGRHEVIVETADSQRELADFSLSELIQVVRVWRDRLRAAASDPRIQWAVVFKNDGRDAGASLSHAHSQLLALTSIPPDVAMLRAAELDWWRTHRRCATCDELAREETIATRVVQRSNWGLLYCPWFSRFPYELRIAAWSHQPCFTDLEEVEELAKLFQAALVRLGRVLPGVAYNAIVRVPPFREPNHDEPPPDEPARVVSSRVELASHTHSDRMRELSASDPASHWWIEILPRVSRWAGFELSSGVPINIVDPDDAAERLRDRC